MLVQKEILIVDGLKLPDFLYSCAVTEVLRKDVTIISETSMVFFTARRVSEKLTPNERKVAALLRAAQLMSEFLSKSKNPKAQASFLVNLDAQRKLQRSKIASMFADVQRGNDGNDRALYFAAQTANDVQSVATIALCVIAVGGPMAAGAGISSIGAGVLSAGTRLGSAKLTAAAYFAIPLAFKSITAYATADEGTTLWGFAVGSVKDGVISLGELSSNAFNLAKDASIGYTMNLMNLAIGQWGKACMAFSYTATSLMKDRNSLLSAMMKTEQSSAIYARMARDLKEIEQRIGVMANSNRQVASTAVRGAASNSWMSTLGGRFVPLAFLTADTFGEYWRHSEQQQKIVQSGKVY